MSTTRSHRVNRIALRKIRKERKLSQDALSESTGLHQGYISRLEGGQRTHVRAVSLRALASALAVEPEALIDQAV